MLNSHLMHTCTYYMYIYTCTCTYTFALVLFCCHGNTVEELQKEQQLLSSLKEDISQRREAVEQLEELARKFEFETEVCPWQSCMNIHVHVEAVQILFS